MFWPRMASKNPPKPVFGPVTRLVAKFSTDGLPAKFTLSAEPVAVTLTSWVSRSVGPVHRSAARRLIHAPLAMPAWAALYVNRTFTPPPMTVPPESAAPPAWMKDVPISSSSRT